MVGFVNPSLGFYESHSFSFPVSEATTSGLAHPYMFSSVPHLRRGQMRGKYRPCFKESQPGDEVSHSRQPVGRVGAKGPLKQELAKEQSLPSMSQAEVNSWTLGAAASYRSCCGNRLRSGALQGLHTYSAGDPLGALVLLSVVLNGPSLSPAFCKYDFF